MSDAFFTEQDGSITIHTITDSSELAVDAWAEAAARLIEATPPGEIFLMLMDVSAKQVSFTRYARQKSLTLFTDYKHRRGRLAMLFSSRISPYFARIFFASLGKLEFEYEYFSSREQALEWLRAGRRETHL
ncbi:MAG: hypothetical protein ABI835_07745 [Chloroflexota bacterium]